MTNPFFEARPIWTHEDSLPNTYAEFRETLCYTDGIALLTLSVDTQFAVYVNGQFAATGQFADYPDEKVYEIRDLRSYLRCGENEVRILAYCQNTPSSTYRPGKPYLIYTITVDGQPVCCSGVSTLCRPAVGFVSGAVEKITGQLGYSFRFSADAPETAWQPATVIDGVTEKFLPRPVAPLCVGEPMAAQVCFVGDYRESAPSDAPSGVRMQRAWLRGRRISALLPSVEGLTYTAAPDADGICLTVDLGQETVGFLTLDFVLPCAAEVLVGWGEHLDDGRVRTEVGGRNFAAQIYARAGENHFFNPLRRLGLRYLTLHIAAPTITIHTVSVCPVDYPLPAQRFHCDDPLHDRILSVGLRTLALCMHDHYEDCPWREQALYAMDSRNQMLCGYYAWGEYRFARASLALMAHSLREDGQLELCSPAACPITIPAFTAVWVTALAEYLSYSGDDAFVRDMLPTARAICAGFRARTREDGLLTCFAEARYWNFYEWQSGLSGSIAGSVSAEDLTCDAPLCAFVTMAYRALADICDALGENDAANEWAAAGEAMGQAAHRAFYDDEQGLYFSYLRLGTGERFHLAELTQALFLYAGICPPAEQARVRAALAAGVGLLPVTLSHSIYKYDALMQDAAAYAPQVRREIECVWGGMLARGATSFWETVQGADDFSYAGSLCHGWSAAPVYLYGRYHRALGIALS